MNKALWITVAKEAYEAQQIKQEAAERERKALEQLKELSKHRSASAGDFVFALSYRKGSVDYSSIPELESIDLERYRKEEVMTWKLIRMEK